MMTDQPPKETINNQLDSWHVIPERHARKHPWEVDQVTIDGICQEIQKIKDEDEAKELAEMPFLSEFEPWT